VSWATVREIHARMMQEIARAGGQIEAVLCCPYLVDVGCDRRKPTPGLLRRAHEENRVDLKQAILVGDSVKDVQTAIVKGLPSTMVLSGLGRIADLGSASLPCRLTFNLAYAARLILNDAVLLTPDAPHQGYKAISDGRNLIV